MAANAFETIKQAEAQAKLIRQEGVEEAQKILATAEKNGEALIEQARLDARNHRSDALRQADEKAKQVISDAEHDARVKAAVLTSTAGQNKPDAEALILERIGALWQ